MTTQTLDPPPFEIESQSELEILISEVATLDAKAKKLKADHESEKAKLEEKFAVARLVKIGKGKQAREMTIEERREEILAAAHIYCQEHPDAWQAADKKSRNYPGGTIGYRKAKDAVIVSSEKKPKQLSKEWTQAAVDWAADFIPIDSIELPLNKLADVTVKLKSPSKFFELLKDGDLKKKQLRTLGMRFRDGEDELFIDTSKGAVD